MVPLVFTIIELFGFKKKKIVAFSILVLVEISKDFLPWRITSTILESPSSKILPMPTVKKVETREFNVFSAVTNWIKISAVTNWIKNVCLKLCLNLCSWRWLKPNLNLVNDIIPLRLLQRNTLFIIYRRYKFQNVTFATSETFVIGMFKSSLFYSIIVEGK